MGRRLDKRVKQLEERVRELEARPVQPIIMLPAPIVQPYPVIQPWRPWYQPYWQVTSQWQPVQDPPSYTITTTDCGGSGNFVDAGFCQSPYGAGANAPQHAVWGDGQWHGKLT